MPRVSFTDDEPSEKEFFEEYDKYNATCWFLLIFILKSLIPLCFALQVGPFKHSEGIELILKEFSIPLQNQPCDEIKLENLTGMQNMHLMYKTACYRKEVFLQINYLNNFGYLAGGVLGGILADLFGRRTVCVCLAFIWNVSAWLLLFPKDITIAKIVYVVMYSSSSGIFAISFVNFAEIANRKNRFLSIFTNASYLLGDLMSYFIISALPVWKFLLIFIATTNSLIIFICLYIPESPRWLLNRNKKKEAYDQLTDISGMLYAFVAQESEKNESPKERTFCKMFEFLLTKKRKHFLVIFFSTVITSLNCSCARMKTIFYSLYTKNFDTLGFTPEVLGYLLLIPVYIFLGKRKGLMLIFMLLCAESLMAFFMCTSTNEVYFYTFIILSAATGTHLNCLYILDLFPTFLRATVFGFCWSLIGFTQSISSYIVVAVSDFTYHIFFFISAIFGMVILMLPESANQELSNFKLE